MLQIFYTAIPIVYVLLLSYQIFQQFHCKQNTFLFLSINITCSIVCRLVVNAMPCSQYTFTFLWFFIMLVQLYTMFDFTRYKSIWFAIILVFQLFAFTSIIENLQTLFSIYETMPIIQLIITLLCVLLLFKCNFIKRFDNIYKSKMHRKFLLFWLIGFNILFIFITLFNHIYYAYLDNQMFYLNISIIFILGVFILLQYTQVSLNLENTYHEITILRHQSEYRNIAYNQQKEYIKSLRKLKHDMSNQLKSILYLMQDKNYMEAHAYVEELSQKLVEVSKQYSVYSDHRLLDDVFQHMNTICKAKAISFSAVLRIGNIDVNDHDIYMILSHYFEELMKQHEKRQMTPYAIRIYSKCNEHWLAINFESSMHQLIKLKKQDEVNEIPKEIKNVVEKLDACIINDIDEKNNDLKTTLLIPIHKGV